MLTVIYRKTDDLIPYVSNSRTHSEAQVAQIAASVREFGFTNPILIDEEGGVIAGCGRLMAARKLNLEEVPTITLEGLSKAQKRAYLIADNKLALNAGWDEELLKVEIEELADEHFDLALTGFSQEELATLFDEPEKELEIGLDEQYSKKIKAPIYEIKGENPAISELLDDSKTNQLIENIRAAGLPADITDFLIHAAQRHTRFNFRQIAERYAHSDKATQELFEQSGLVIIDFDKAIENGFVSLSAQLGVLADQEMAEADDEG